MEYSRLKHGDIIWRCFCFLSFLPSVFLRRPNIPPTLSNFSIHSCLITPERQSRVSVSCPLSVNNKVLCQNKTKTKQVPEKSEKVTRESSVLHHRRWWLMSDLILLFRLNISALRITHLRRSIKKKPGIKNFIWFFSCAELFFFFLGPDTPSYTPHKQILQLKSFHLRKNYSFYHL